MLRQVRRACSVLPCEACRLQLNFSVVHRLQRFVRLVYIRKVLLWRVLSTWYLILRLPPLAATGAYSAQSHSFSFLLLSSVSIYVCIVMFLCWWVFTTAIKAWVSCRGDCTSIVSFWTESTKDLIRTALESILPAGAAAAVSVCAESSSIKSWPGHCPEGQSRVLILKLYDGDIY